MTYNCRYLCFNNSQRCGTLKVHRNKPGCCFVNTADVVACHKSGTYMYIHKRFQYLFMASVVYLCIVVSNVQGASRVLNVRSWERFRLNFFGKHKLWYQYITRWSQLTPLEFSYSIPIASSMIITSTINWEILSV